MGKAEGDWGTKAQEFLQRFEEVLERICLGGGETFNDGIRKRTVKEMLFHFRGLFLEPVRATELADGDGSISEI